MQTVKDRILVWVTPGEAAIVEPLDVYWLVADGRNTWVRLGERVGSGTRVEV